MELVDVSDWLDDNAFTRDGVLWCLKRFSVNGASAASAIGGISPGHTFLGNSGARSFRRPLV